MGVLAQAKNGDERFGNRNFMQPRGRFSMHSKCLVLGGGKRGFLNFFPLFPTCSLQVPNGFSAGSLYIP
jgi:hypothetical protein